MPEGGNIKIWAENTNVVKKDSLPLKEGRYVKIGTKDQGTGISQEHLQKIFDPYFTNKQKGSGLGLAITYSIIKKHGGHITVESEIGVGTTFHIYLPASRKEAIEKPVLNKVREKDVEEVPITGQGYVLLVEDERILRNSIVELLRRLGYEVEAAEDGSEAIELYKGVMESGKPFDVVILDLTIPGGMGGKEAIKKLLKIDPDAKVIVSSGFFNDPVMSNFREYGFKDAIAKPHTIYELHEALQKVIKGENE
jgi:CheY-like chemotaxis protein